MILSEYNLEASLLTSATEVLESMYFTSVVGLQKVAPDDHNVIEGGGPLATLEFKGEMSGTFTLSMAPETARMLAANFFGEDELDVTDVSINEMVGEMANMICGSVLSRLETESHFKLTHPVVEIAGTEEEATANDGPGSSEVPSDGLIRQRLETESGVLALCLRAQ